MNDPGLTSVNRVWLPLMVSLLLSFVLYFPLLGNTFAADDFGSVYRAGVKADIFGTGFFRPLSDFTLYLNYLLAGVRPFSYHATNIVFHACSACLLYLFCLTADYFTKAGRKREVFATVAALLFLTYPFHNESVAWVVGRGSIIATFFAIATMLIVVSDMQKILKFTCAGLFFFIGLLAYESIIVLPAIVIILVWKREKSLIELFKWLTLFVIVLVGHLFIRYRFSGSLAGEYGQFAFSHSVFTYAANLLKVTGRMLLPPTDHSILLIVGFSILMISFLLSRFFWRSRRPKGAVRKKELTIIMLLFIAMIIPISFSVSTRTSEGERLLYFPSVFLSMLFALMLVELGGRRLYRRLIFIALLTYNIVFVEVNNRYWRKASEITVSMIAQIKQIAATGGKVLLVNLPGEYRGAYIFRNSFEGVKLLNGINSGQVQVANYLNHGEYAALAPVITPFLSGESVCFGLAACLYGRRLTVTYPDKPGQSPDTIFVDPEVDIWFWNKHALIEY
jgi:protein O-mannosyl-transferase